MTEAEPQIDTANAHLPPITHEAFSPTKRFLIISTDGTGWKVERSDCSKLEMKALCLELLKQLGG